MNQVLALFRSEYIKNKSSYWWPVWIIGGLTVLSLLTLLVALIGNISNIHIMGLDHDSGDLRVAMYGLMFSFSIVFFIFLILTSQSSLNREKQLGCDLFFRCQPVSVWTLTMVKYIMHVFAASLTLLALGLVYAFVMSFVNLFVAGGFYPGEALYGAFLGWLTYLKAAMVFGSLFFLFSSIFRSGAFLKGMAALGILEGVFAIIESIFRHQINLPGVFENLAAMVGNLAVENITEVNMSIVMGDHRIIFGVLFAAICYTAATLIYAYRAKDA